MARLASVQDDELLRRLSRVFRTVGYEGASLTMLSEATGLKKASLYHRFPGGKEQMAREVLGAADAWLSEHILTPLTSDEPPEIRIQAMIAQLNAFYEGGRQACLLNILSSPVSERGPFFEMVEAAFRKWIAALATALEDAGFDREAARRRAEHAVTRVQGSLVLSRGLKSTAPFEECLATLERELLA